MKDVILVSHNDLDGVGSTLIAEYTFRKNKFNILDSKNVGNHEVDATILEALDLAVKNDNPYGTAIVVTDVTPSAEMAEYIDSFLDNEDNRNISLRVLDHHKHALFLNKYHWADIVVERDDIKTSGTSLVTDFLHDEGYDIDHTVLEFSEIVRRYDTWDWVVLGDEEPKRLNDLLYIIGHGQFKEMVEQILEGGESFKIDEEYELILDIENKRIQDYIKRKSKEIKFHLMDFELGLGKMYNVGVVVAERYFSELGNELANLFADADIVAMIDIGSKKVSLRTNKDDVDVSVIAKELGGGGHPKASGYPLSNKSLREMLDLVVDM